MLNFKSDQDIERLVESLNSGSPKKMNEPNFSDFLMEMVEEVLTGKKAKAAQPSCGKQKPTDPDKRFEYVVIARARAAVGGSASVDPQGKCAAGEWYATKDKSGNLKKTRIGGQADAAVEQALRSGFFDKSELQSAGMTWVEKSAEQDGEGIVHAVGKTKPAHGGKPIEAKTDIFFGSKRISLKMGGAVQAASAEGPGTAEALARVMDNWIKQYGPETVQKAVHRDAAIKVKELFASVKDKMIETGKHSYLSTTRGAGIIKDIKKWKDRIATHEKWEALRTQLQADQPGIDLAVAKEKFAEDIEPTEFDTKAKTAKTDFERYSLQNSKANLTKKEMVFNKLTVSGVVNAQGEIIKDEFKFENYSGDVGSEDLAQEIKNIFNTTIPHDSEADEQLLSLREALADELMTGRRTFGEEGKDAVAQYVLNPSHCHSLNPSDGADYKNALKIYSQAIELRVDPKGGRTLKTKKGGTIAANVGVKVAFRYDITKETMEAAINDVAIEVFSEWTKIMGAALAGSNTGTEPMQEEMSEKEAEATATAVVEKSIGALEEKIMKLLVNAVDAKKTAASMLGGGES